LRRISTIARSRSPGRGESADKEHGRIEVRKIAVSAEVIPYLDWPGTAQVARIERTREIGGKVSTEIAYIVTSLTAAEADPERLLELSRGHWAIENRLHYVRDVTFGEDRCRVRAGARALAVIRNLVLHLIRSRGMAVPEARETSAKIALRSSHSSQEGFFEWPCRRSLLPEASMNQDESVALWRRSKWAWSAYILRQKAENQKAGAGRSTNYRLNGATKPANGSNPRQWTCLPCAS
jgi:Transposase DDE domain